jgi:hypothetical protein
MQAVLGIFEQHSVKEQKRVSHLAAFGHWLGGMFGCPHKEMSRPFSRHGETYRVCINCGARRGFDQQAWNSAGPFYFNPASTTNLIETGMSTVRCA